MRAGESTVLMSLLPSRAPASRHSRLFPAGHLCMSLTFSPNSVSITGTTSDMACIKSCPFDTMRSPETKRTRRAIQFHIKSCKHLFRAKRVWHQSGSLQMWLHALSRDPGLGWSPFSPHPTPPRHGLAVLPWVVTPFFCASVSSLVYCRWYCYLPFKIVQIKWVCCVKCFTDSGIYMALLFSLNVCSSN